MAENIQLVHDLLSNDKKKGGLVRLEEFLWDHFLKYIASLILALTVLNVTVEFLRGGGIFCFPPTDNAATNDDNLQGDRAYEFGQGQTNYINNYCARIIEKTEYFPIYILIHGILLLIPHYIWNAYFRGDFGSFFSVVNKLDHLRDETGEYDSDKFELVNKLELKYKKHKKIYLAYIAKLIAQFVVCVVSIGITSRFFLDCEIAFSFCCPDVDICSTPETIDLPCSKNISGDVPKGWPLDINVPCIYTSRRILDLVRWADLSLLILASILIIIGGVWCCVRHIEQLGYKDIAKFSFHSCLNSDFHSFQSQLYSCSCCNKVLQKKHICKPNIRNDLDFLVLMLFRSDTTHGLVFKSIQVNKYLKDLIDRDNQQLNLFFLTKNAEFHKQFLTAEARTNILFNPEKKIFDDDKEEHLGNLNLVEELTSNMRSLIYYCVNNCGPENWSHNLAVDISFESVGFAPVLARPYQKVISLNFSKNVQGTSEISRFYTALKLPTNSYAQATSKTNEVHTKIEEKIGQDKIDFIVVGPLIESPRKVIVKLLLSHLQPKCSSEARLLIIRPLKVGSKDLTERFPEYIPPKQLFEPIDLECKKDKNVKWRYVSKSSGFKVKINNIRCIYEFSFYKCSKKVEETPL